MRYAQWVYVVGSPKIGSYWQAFAFQRESPGGSCIGLFAENIKDLEKTLSASVFLPYSVTLVWVPWHSNHVNGPKLVQQLFWQDMRVGELVVYPKQIGKGDVLPFPLLHEGEVFVFAQSLFWLIYWLLLESFLLLAHNDDFRIDYKHICRTVCTDPPCFPRYCLCETRA